MELPNNVTQAYDTILQLQAQLEKGEPTDELVDEFARILNRAIPPVGSAAYAIYSFNRCKYTANRRRFLADILGFHPYESMILWANADDIINFFKLKNKICLEWSQQNCFTATRNKSALAIPDKFESGDDQIQTMTYLDDRDDEMERLYQRLALTQAQFMPLD